MEIKKMKLSEINLMEENPRKDLTPIDPEYKNIEASLDSFGLVIPLVFNKRSSRLISGHQRLRVLKTKGVEEVDVSIVDLSPSQEKQLNLALNRVTGVWDEEKLSAMLSDLTKMPDFDLAATGFGQEELSRILDFREEGRDGDQFDFDKEVESITTPVTQRGDIVELGPHRIMCGDSANKEDLTRLMNGARIDLVHTDPPYGCSYLAQNRPDLESRPKKSKRWEKLYKDDLNEKEYETWLRSVLSNIREHLKEGAPAYIWNGHAKFYFTHQVLKELGFHISTVITWAKPNFAISYGDFNQQTEFCLYSWLKTGPHRWYGPTNESNLWEINRDKAADLIHPTQKSVQIPSRAIRNSSKRGDLVFDGFLGSGSTLIAAESLGRRCYGTEIEPKYIDGIVRRYIDFVGTDKVAKALLEKYTKEADHGVTNR